MASTLPAVCFVRCPKCLRVLAEFPEIPPFKCCGCDAILSAKVHSDICSKDNGLTIHVKQISTASYEHEILEQEATKWSDDSESNEEKNLEELESSGYGIKTLSVSESNGGSSKEKRESAVYELNGINEKSLEQAKLTLAGQSAHSLNQEVRKSSDQIVPEANDGLNSSYKLEQPPESLEHDKVNEELRNGIGFRLRTRSSHSNDRSFSSSDEQLQDHVPQKHVPVSRRTRSRKVLNSDDSIKATDRDDVMKNSANAEEQPAAGKFSIKSSGNSVQAREQDTLFASENDKPSSISQSEDAEQVAKLHYSEKDDKVKILEKFDELKIELHRLFSKEADGKEASSFGMKVTHSEGKFESNENLSSLTPFSRQSSNSSCLLCHSAGTCYHSGNCWAYQETQFRHCRPISGGAPFVICYKCYKLLQLPVDFLVVSTKKIHKLRCGSCSEVLVYSFRPRTRTAPNQ